MSTKAKPVWKEEKPEEDKIYGGESILLNDPGTINQHEANKIGVEVGKDGAIMFSSDTAESFIYFYPQQLPHLAKAVRIAVKQDKEAKKAKARA